MFASALSATLIERVEGWLASYALVIFMLTLGFLIERLRLLERKQPRAATRFGLAYSAVASVIDHAVRPLTSMFAMSVVHALGGGIVTLPSHGAGAIGSFVVMFLTLDLLEYVFHRLQHSVPFLWRLHSFHHSASTFNVTVTLRHHWIEPAIKICFLYPIAAILFKVDLWIVSACGACFVLVNYFAHMNLRLELGRFGAWFNNPQYHHLHHARAAEYYDRNFTQFLPLWDLLGGTMRLPIGGEWPETGLVDAHEPSTIREALRWPLGSSRIARMSAVTPTLAAKANNVTPDLGRTI